MKYWLGSLVGWIAACALIWWGLWAHAQNSYVTPSGQYVTGEQQLCQNASNQSVPCVASPPMASQYPVGAIAVTASATGTTAAVTATLPGASAKTTFVCGFAITSGATLGLGSTATMTGTISGSLNYVQPIGALPGVAQLQQAFSPCVPASAVNTGIAVQSGAAGVGGNTAVSAWGYQQ
jgi:hypothetical protein